MKNQFYLLALAAAFATTATAQKSYTFARPDVKAATTVTTAMHGRTLNSATPQRAGAPALSEKGYTAAGKTAPVVRVRKAGDVDNPYGESVTILYEDFSKMTTGSIDSPDEDTDINIAQDDPDYKYPWWNLKPEYTNLPHWGANNAFPAGGCIFLNADIYNQQASLNTPLVDCSGYDNIATLQFKARTRKGTSTGLYVEAAETHNMSPSWDIMGNAMLPEVKAEWQTYEVTFYNAGPTTIFNIVQMQTGPIYIDDVKVYQIKQKVNTPVTMPHSDYTDNSFKANWHKVEGADAYLLNVYSYDANNNVVDFLTDQKVTDTTYTVTGTESGKTYYYTVRAVKGIQESMASAPVEVYDIAAPVMNEATNVADGKYSASWTTPATAERYNYWAYCERTATEDGPFTVTSEDFTGVLDADGNPTGWTVENPSENTYDDYYPGQLAQGGWHAENGAPYTDFICVDGWQAIYNNSQAGLISPELDLSKDNGNINLSVKLYGTTSPSYDEKGNPDYSNLIQTRAAVALFNYDEKKGDYVQDELIYPDGVSPEWKDFDIKLTKGTKRTVIGIFAVTGPANLYIDDLKITQNYKKGETLKDPYLMKHWYDGTSIDVTVPARASDMPLYHKVNAVKARGQGDQVAYKESKYSDLKKVSDGMTDVANVTFKQLPVVTADGTVITVTNPAAAPVQVYTVSGTLLKADNSGSFTVSVPATRGVYIVKVGDNVMKVRN